MPRFTLRSHADPTGAQNNSRAPEIAHRRDPLERINSLQRCLLDWYLLAQRKLPWRGSSDPYAILVSEVMLQQTQVERVQSKYLEFLQRFPTLAALAGAPRAEVIRAWAPLGYNRRAVRLHELAAQVSAQYAGNLPSDPADLADLPGLGSYTSAAVACFAFGRQIATVDTNIRRVLIRVFAERFDSGAPKSRAVAALATEVLPTGQAANWNQALMDLGATVCTARAPKCGACPLEDDCSTSALFATPENRARQLAAEARATYRPEQPFQQSTRYFRGRVIARLRELPAGETLELEALGRAIKSDFLESDMSWLLELVRGLISDGLVNLVDTSVDPRNARISLP